MCSWQINDDLLLRIAFNAFEICAMFLEGKYFGSFSSEAIYRVSKPSYLQHLRIEIHKRIRLLSARHTYIQWRGLGKGPFE